MSLWLLLLIGCTSPCRLGMEQHTPELIITPEHAVRIARKVFEDHCLDPLSWYRVELLPDNGGDDWRILFDGISHSGPLGRSMKVVLVNKRTGDPLYIPGY